jgi:hypothetical protein
VYGTIWEGEGREIEQENREDGREGGSESYGE